jgi:hypothetical protein
MKNLRGARKIWGMREKFGGVREKFGGCLRNFPRLWGVYEEKVWCG